METSPPPVENPVPAPPPTSPPPVPASPPTSPMAASPPPAVANQPDPQVPVPVRVPLRGRARLAERLNTINRKNLAEFRAGLKQARRSREKRMAATWKGVSKREEKRQRVHSEKDKPYSSSSSSDDDDQKAACEADSHEDTSDEGSEEHNGGYLSFLRVGRTNNDGEDSDPPIDNTDCLDKDDRAGPKPRSSDDEV